MENRYVLPPGPRALPLLGNALQFRRDQLAFLLELERTYGRMATIYIGKTPIVLFFRPEHIRYVLTENPRNFTSREVAGGLIYGKLLVLSLLARNFTDKAIQGLHDIIGDGLLTTDGDFHHRHRRLLQPAFSRRRVENYAGLVVGYTKEMVERWQSGGETDIARDMQALILRLTIKMLVDIDPLNQDAEFAEIIDGLLGRPIGILEGLLNLRIDLPITQYGRRMALKRRLDAYVYDLIDRRLAARSDVGDILSILLAAHDTDGGEGMPPQQVRDELVALTAAGHETTTNSMAWTFYLLSEHPPILKRVLAELETVLAGRDARADDVPRLTYLDWVVKESMRLYPSAWTQGRQAVEAFDLDGYHFPAGVRVMFSQWVLHRLPDVWGDPEVFRPERWDPAHGQKAPQWAYFPFGGGSRICLGMPLAQLQIRLVLATILQHYVPRLAPGHAVVPLPLITLRLKHGLRMRLEPGQAPVAVEAPADAGVKK